MVVTADSRYGRCRALFEDRFPFLRFLGPTEDWSELGWIARAAGMLRVAFLLVWSRNDSQRSPIDTSFI